jgi:hypothetical protein
MDNETQQLALIDKASQMLAQATDIRDVKTIRDKAAGVQAVVRAAKLGLKAYNQAAELKIRAERRAGEMLAKMPKNKGTQLSGRRRSQDASAETLAELGIGHDQASRWQKIASVPESKFESFIAETKRAEMELTSAGILSIARSCRPLKRSAPKIKPKAKAADKVVYDRRELAELSKAVSQIRDVVENLRGCLGGQSPLHCFANDLLNAPRNISEWLEENT